MVAPFTPPPQRTTDQSGQSSLGSLVQPANPLPPPDFARPQTQQEDPQVSGWVTFLEKLSTDTALRQGLLAAGAQMMQPRRGGQTQAGAIGQGVQAFSQASTAETQRLSDNALAQQRANTNARFAGAQEGANEQRTLDRQQRAAEFDAGAGERTATTDLRTAQAAALGPDSPQTQATVTTANAALARSQNVGQTAQDREMATFITNEIAKGSDPSVAIDAWFEFKLKGKTAGSLFEAKLDIFETVQGLLEFAPPEQVPLIMEEQAKLLAQAEAEFGTPAGGSNEALLDPDPHINARMKEIAIESGNDPAKLTSDQLIGLRAEALVDLKRPPGAP